jgi:hypothetical protein
MWIREQLAHFLPYRLLQIDSGLREAGRLLGNPGEFGSKQEEIVRLLFVRYFGSGGATPLEKARYHDVEMNRLLCEMDQAGIGEWLNRRWEELGLTPLPNRSWGFRRASENGRLRQLFYCHGQPVNVDLIAASHGTESDAFDSILNAGALLSFQQIKEKGLRKMTGESGRDSGAAAGKKISFWTYDPGANKRLGGGYGSGGSGFSYPIALAINTDSAAQVSFEASVEIAGEHTVEGELRLSMIDSIAVPSFAVDDTRRVLAQHGHGHIAVHLFPDLTLRSPG